MEPLPAPEREYAEAACAEPVPACFAPPPVPPFSPCMAEVEEGLPAVPPVLMPVRAAPPLMPVRAEPPTPLAAALVWAAARARPEPMRPDAAV